MSIKLEMKLNRGILNIIHFTNICPWLFAARYATGTVLRKIDGFLSKAATAIPECQN